MANVVLVYDISDDRTRTKVADVCLDYGLDRIQYSAFMGLLSRNLQEELFMRVERLLDDAPGESEVQIIPVSAKDWADRLVVNHVG